MIGEMAIAELRLIGRRRAARIVCDKGLVPGPGRYLMAHDGASDAPLATEVFAAGYCADGFIAAPPLGPQWRAGTELNVRGPLGHGFLLPPDTRRLVLIAFNADASRLLPLAEAAARPDAAVALVCADPPPDLPLQVEVHPPTELPEVCAWADYAAFDVERDSLGELVNALRGVRVLRAEVLVRAPMPCGALAECGVCTVRTRKGPRLACVDGPVFNLDLLVSER